MRERKYLIHRGLQRVKRDGLIHLFKIRARTDVNALEMDLLVQERSDLKRLSGLAENTDLRDGSANANRLQRLGEGTGAADLDDQVSADAARLFKHPFRPIRRVLIVHAGVESETVRALQLVVAARCAKNTRSQQLRELQREDGHSSRALDHDRVARLNASCMNDGIPPCNSSAGQRRS